MIVPTVVVVDEAVEAVEVVDVAAVEFDDFDFESDREIFQRMTYEKMNK